MAGANQKISVLLKNKDISVLREIKICQFN